MRRTDDSGSALVVAVFIIGILLAAAVPLAMYFAGLYREASIVEHRTRAMLAAEGAADHALAAAFMGAEGNERNGSQPAPFNTPDFDTWEEFSADFSFRLFPGLAQVFRSYNISFQNPAGIIWHSELEDEQGKIDLNSAPPQLLGNLLGSALLSEPLRRTDPLMQLDNADYFPSDGDPHTVDGTVRVGWEEITYRTATSFTLEGLGRNLEPGEETFHRRGTLVYDIRADRLADSLYDGKDFLPFHSSLEIASIIGYHDFRRLEPFVTVFSGQEGASGWQRKEPVVHRGLPEDSDRVAVKDGAGFGNGALVRLLLNGECVFVGRVRRARPGRDGADLVLDREIGVEVSPEDELSIEARIPRPINVNTAPVPVLYALFKGVALKGENDAVDHSEAEALAREAAGRYFTGPASFKAFLEEMRDKGIISRKDADALYTNATEAFSPSLRVATLPFTWKSFGDVTLVGRAVSNDRFGRTLAESALRQVVSVPGESSGEWGVSSQADFQAQLDASHSPGTATWPEPVEAGRAPDERSMDPETPEDPFGDVRLKSLRDERPFRRALLSDHFEKEGPYTLTPDGADLSNGGALRYDSRRCFSKRGEHIEPVYFSAWVKAPVWDARRRFLFSCGSSADSNRISFYFDGRTRRLVLEAAGPDRQRGFSSFSVPFEPEPDTWYHLAAQASGDRPGDGMIFIDGLPADASVLSFEPSGKLENAIGPDDTRLTLDDASFLPASGGAVQIDQEIIEYSAVRNNTLLNLRRGARYSFKAAHQGGALVIPFGYSNTLAGPLPRGGERLVGDVAAVPSTRLTADLKAGSSGSIEVAGTEGFPPSGFLRIGGRENVYYSGLSETSFTGVVRGELNSSPAAHAAGAPVVSLSLEITGPGDYRTGEFASLEGPGGKLEWLRIPRMITRNGHTYIVREVDRLGRPRGSWRGVMDTFPLPHRDGTKLIPVVRLQGPQCGDRNSPTGEEITIIQDQSAEIARIRRAHARRWAERRPDGTVILHYRFTACLYDFTSRAYEAGRARFLKPPSGEMPVSLPSVTFVAAESDGASELGGMIDEVRFGTALSPSGVLPPERGISAAETSITVLENHSNFSSGAPSPSPRPSGVVRIGNEYIFYRSVSTGSFRLRKGPEDVYSSKPDTLEVAAYTLSGCIRGILGSGRTAHPAGEPVQFLDEFPVSILTGNLSAKGDGVSLLDASAFPEEGYLQVLDNSVEVLGWTGKRGNVLSGAEHIRGCFGTPVSSHPAGILCRWIPARYPSRYEKDYDGPELVYFAASRSVGEAVWKAFSYSVSESDGGGDDTTMRVRAVLKFSDDIGWAAAPTGTGKGLFEYTSDGRHELPGVRSDLVKVRFYFQYLPGAFDGNGWKSTLKVDNFFLEYSTAPVVRRTDVVE